jgi:hypothetical protein
MIAEKLGARIERRQRNFALLHHLEPRLHVGQASLQRISGTPVEGEVNRSVFFFRQLDAKRFAVPFGFSDHPLRNEVMMNIDGATFHSFLLRLLPIA